MKAKPTSSNDLLRFKELEKGNRNKMIKNKIRLMKTKSSKKKNKKKSIIKEKKPNEESKAKKPIEESKEEKKPNEENKKIKNPIEESKEVKKPNEEVSTFRKTDTKHIENLKNTEKIDSQSGNGQLQKPKEIKDLNAFTRIHGYFKKTSKENQSTAMNALMGFLLGFILYFASIHLVCWNERRAVRECQYLDKVKKESQCKEVKKGEKIENSNFNENLCYIIKGNLFVNKEANIPDLDIDFKKKIDNDEKIIFLKTNLEKFSIIEEEESKKVMINGEEKEEVKTNFKKLWEHFYLGQEKLEEKVYYGNVIKFL